MIFFLFCCGEYLFYNEFWQGYIWGFVDKLNQLEFEANIVLNF